MEVLYEVDVYPTRYRVREEGGDSAPTYLVVEALVTTAPPSSAWIVVTDPDIIADVYRRAFVAMKRLVKAAAAIIDVLQSPGLKL